MLAQTLFNIRRRITPDCGIRMTRQALGTELHSEQDLVSPDQAGAILDGLEARTLEIMDQDASWQQDIPSMKKLEWAASILAAHELLMERIGDEARSLAILDRTMQRSWDTAWNRFLGRRVASNVRRHGSNIRQVMNGLLGHYGTGWHWKIRRSKDDPQVVVVWASHCFYMKFMASHGHPELTPLFRNIDDMWMSMPSNNQGAFRVDANAPRAPEDKDRPIVFTFISTETRLHP